MGVQEWLVFVGTVLVFMSTPGPSQLLMLSNSIGSGFRRSLFTAGGDLTANLLQMIVASVGLVSLIVSSRSFFVVVKWAGVAYLVYLGLKMVLSKPNADLDREAPEKSGAALYWQGFFTSAANPKAEVFFAALFPQFIDPERALVGQFMILSATYLVIDATFLCMYGKGADWISQKLRPTARQQLNRVAGSFLLGAAVLLGLKDGERR